MFPGALATREAQRAAEDKRQKLEEEKYSKTLTETIFPIMGEHVRNDIDANPDKVFLEAFKGLDEMKRRLKVRGDLERNIDWKQIQHQVCHTISETVFIHASAPSRTTK